MNYGRIANGIALGLMTATSLAVLVGMVALWVGDAPIVICVLTTLLVLAVTAFIVFAELDDRQRR